MEGTEDRPTTGAGRTLRLPTAPAVGEGDEWESDNEALYGGLWSFPARQGDRAVTVTGTVVPSRLVHWRRVRVSSGAVVEVRTEHLTPVR